MGVDIMEVFVKEIKDSSDYDNYPECWVNYQTLRHLRDNKGC